MAVVSAQDSLEFVEVNILGPCLTTKRGNKLLLDITDRLPKLVQTVPLRSITAVGVDYAFLTHGSFTYGPLIEVMSENGKEFASRVFQYGCRILDV